MANLNKFRSQNVIQKSHNTFNGLTLRAIIVFNMVTGSLLVKSVGSVTERWKISQCALEQGT